MRRAAILVLVLAGVASGHDVPVVNSVCNFDPLEITAPAAGVDATAAPAPVAEAFRVLYDVASGTADLCIPDPAAPDVRCALIGPARAFAGSGVTGTIAMSLVRVRVFTSGDLTATAVPIVVGTSGETATVSVPLTTGLIAVGGSVVEGSPMTADGAVTLVGTGVTDALPPPLGGTPLVFRMTCTATPPPDLDQFTTVSRTTALAGALKSDGARLRVAFRAGIPAAALPDFTQPAIVRLAAGAATIATLDLPAGLQAQGKRKFIGVSADGASRVVVRRGLGRGRYTMALRLAPVTIPPGSGPSVDAELTYQVGGLLSRRARTLRIRGAHS